MSAPSRTGALGVGRRRASLHGHRQGGGPRLRIRWQRRCRARDLHFSGRPGRRQRAVVGHKALAAMGPADRTTPAGRFVASMAPDLGGQDILWAIRHALALHRVGQGTPAERRDARLRSASRRTPHLVWLHQRSGRVLQTVVQRVFVAAGSSTSCRSRRPRQPCWCCQALGESAPCVQTCAGPTAHRLETHHRDRTTAARPLTFACSRCSLRWGRVFASGSTAAPSEPEMGDRRCDPAAAVVARPGADAMLHDAVARHATRRARSVATVPDAAAAGAAPSHDRGRWLRHRAHATDQRRHPHSVACGRAGLQFHGHCDGAAAAAMATSRPPCQPRVVRSAASEPVAAAGASMACHRHALRALADGDHRDHRSCRRGGESPAFPQC